MRLWKRLQAALPRLGIAPLIVGFIAFIAFIVYIGVAYYTGLFPDPDWTGFGPPKVNADGQEIAHFKTLWDWLDLLLVPLVLAVGGYFLTRSENRYAQKLQDQRDEKAEQREKERAQDTALQAYLDQMTQLLLHEKLRTSQPGDEVRSVARARTLTVLRVLDGARKATVLQFLYEARLIGGIEKFEPGKSETMDAIVDLAGADLREAHLEMTYLGGVNLRMANLCGANLRKADLSMANLDVANLERASLNGTGLQWAKLQSASLAEAFLEAARLGGARLGNAFLYKAKLKLADLKGADLYGAKLHEADLYGAKLHEADLREADLSGADLGRATLTNCKITREQLAQAASLEGAELPFDMTPPSVQQDKGAVPKK
jgi:uncharacterized protein YjbI with pentapeptide repeats